MSEIQSDRKAPAPTQSVFLNAWRIYRKMVDNNYLHHREAYARLHDILRQEFARPFRFLDVACGDASASAAALAGTQLSAYHGIDLSEQALEIARGTIAGLGCAASVECGDFPEVLSARQAKADVIWIGLSLHHLPNKLAVMQDAFRLLQPGGAFLIYENTSPDGEDRPGWIRRFEEQRMTWSAYTPEESEVMGAHIRASDFPETVSSWHALGEKAGFAEIREMFICPDNLFRLYAFRKG